MIKRIFFILVCLVTNKSIANLDSKWEFMLSTTTMPISAVTASDNAKKSFLGEIYAPLGFKYNFSPYYVQITSSKLSYISNKDKDSGLKTAITQLEGAYFFNPDSDFLFKTQFGIMMYEMQGSGGKKELRNGTSTSVFDLPSKTKNSQMLYLGVGSQYDFGPISCELDLNILSPFSNTRRNYFLSVLFGVPL